MVSELLSSNLATGLFRLNHLLTGGINERGVLSLMRRQGKKVIGERGRVGKRDTWTKRVEKKGKRQRSVEL